MGVRSRVSTGWAWAAMAAASGLGCVPKTAPVAEVAPEVTPVPEQDERGLAAGERYLVLGDPARATRVLERIPVDDPTHAYAQQLLEVARRDAAAVFDYWIDEVDGLIGEQHFANAEARLEFLSRNQQLSAEQQARVAERRSTLVSRRQEAAFLLDDVAGQARDALLANDLAAALAALRGARSLAWELDPRRALSWEQVMAAVELRRRREEAAAATAATAATAAAAERTTKRRKTDKGTGGDAVSEPELTAEQLKVRSIMREADTFRERKDFFAALQSYMAVLKLDPSNDGVKAVLKELEPRRQALVREYLDKAQEHFMRQNLPAAVPYYRRVLILEPGNEDALEGIKMNDNFERIRNQSTGAPPTPGGP